MESNYNENQMNLTVCSRMQYNFFRLKEFSVVAFECENGICVYKKEGKEKREMWKPGETKGKRKWNEEKESSG